MPSASTKYYHLSSRVKSLPFDAGWLLGWNQSFIKKARGARILVYHGICRERHLRFNTLFLKLSSFEAQLRFYKKYFNLLSLDDYYQQQLSNEKFNICLTFDDGFANNYKYVLPLLEQYEVPAAFFITGIREAGYDILWNDLLSIAGRKGPASFQFSGENFVKNTEGKYISSTSGKRLSDMLRDDGFEQKAELIRLLGSRFNFRETIDKDFWLQMNEDQIQKLSTSKRVTIGSHGYYHNDLSKIPAESAKQELNKSKQFLEKITGKEIKAIAFPYGSYTNELLAMSKSMGYNQLLTTEFNTPRDADEPTLKERLIINPFISTINQAYANISGNY